jgi:diaminohydroxyphosphoribosylaminopyrimidine deaminase/5-amino-6-(5-phosphoribosylamino)uracil reductase
MLLGGRESIPVLGGNGLRYLDRALRLHRVKTVQYGSDIAISGYTEE